MEPRSIRTPGADGVDLHLLEWSGEGVPLLLIHGFSNEAHIWDDFAPHVAPHYRVLALDLRGHGDSGWDPEERYDYEHHVADVEALVDGLGLERLVIVGHSLGGRVSTLFAAENPQRMAGFVLVDSGPELDRRGTVRISMDVEQHKDPSFGRVEEFENYLSLAYPAAQPAAIKRMAAHGLNRREDGRYVLKMDPAFRGKGTRKLSPEDMSAREERLTGELWEALGKIECPTLVVRGAASDIISPEVCDKIVEEVMPNATLAVVAQAGHSVMTDNPEGFREAVGGFVLGE